MNSPEDLETEDADDASVSELLAPLKQIRASEASTSKIRTAVDKELRRSGPARPRKSWWSRSVSVPVPVLIAAGLLFVIVVANSAFRRNDPAESIVNRATEDHQQTEEQLYVSSSG